MRLGIRILFILITSISVTNAAQYIAGDLAPRNTIDGRLDVVDILLLQRFILGYEAPNATESLIADVAPLGNPDGQLNVADLLILQRAVLGDIALAPVLTIPPEPILNTGLSPTSQNPYSITGTATPLATVDVYLNNNLQQTIVTDSSGNFNLDVILTVGLNRIYAIETDNEGNSPSSNILSVDFELADGGTIGGDLSGTILQSNTAYTVTSDVTVNSGQALIIERGAKLEFSPNTQLTVSGSFQVNGTQETPVVFTSVNTNPSDRDWTGIVIQSGASNVVINNAVIEFANDGLYFYQSGNTGTVTNSIIRNNYRGINAYGGQAIALDPTPLITGNAIYNNTQHDYFALNYTNASNVILNATANWWGTSDASLVSPKIFDYNDNVNSPFIDFSAYLDGVNGTSVVANWLFGHITSDTILPGGTVYEVLGSIIVDSGATLTISSGVELNFVSNGSKVDVLGGLISQGTFASPVLFTSGFTSPAAGDWSGVHIQNGASNTVVDQSIIEYAEYGLYFNQSGSIGTVSNSVIRMNRYGVYEYGGQSVTLDPVPAINGNAIYGNTNLAYYANNYANAANVILNATGNWWGTIDATLISPEIYRRTNGNANTPYVDFSAYLDGEKGLPVTGNWLLGPVSIDTNLPSNTVYEVLGNIVIDAGSTLSISSGVELNFVSNRAKLEVHGGLVVQGTLSSPVRFTSGFTNPGGRDWSGIEIYSSASNVMINSAIIEYAAVGLYFNKSGGIGNISNSVIRNNFQGITTAGGRSNVLDPLPVVTGNAIYNNSQYNYNAVNYADASNVLLDATGNWWGTTDPVQIAQNIYDNTDNQAYSPVVDYAGFLSNSIVGPDISAVTISETYISPNSDHIQDATVLSAVLSEPSQWSVFIVDDIETIIHSFSGSGTSINIAWDGLNGTGNAQQDGDYNFIINAIAGARQSIDNERTYPITIDTVAPIADIDDALSNTVHVSVPTVEINGSAVDQNFGNYQLSYSSGVGSDNFTAINLTGISEISNDILLNWVINNSDGSNIIQPGLYTLKLVVEDKAGNSAVDSTIISVNTTDTQPPVIENLTPKNNDLLSSLRATLTGSVNEVANITINGSPVVLNEELSFSHGLALVEGSNTVNIDAADIYNNSISQTMTLNVDIPPSAIVTNLITIQNNSSVLDITGSPGSVEPGANISIVLSGQSYTTAADANGAFYLQLNAQNGDIAEITVIDSAGLRSPTITYTVGEDLQILSPTTGASVNGENINVVGVYTGGESSGVSIANIATCTMNGKFYINNFPLNQGINNIVATQTSQDGATQNSPSVNIIASGTSDYQFYADQNCGVAPLNVTFDFVSISSEIQQLDIDYDNDGVFDISTTTPETTILHHNYTASGVYPVTAWVTSGGVTRQLLLNIVVNDELQHDDMLKAVWNNMRTALLAGDKATAIQFLTPEGVRAYGGVFDSLMPYMTEVYGELSGIERISISNEIADYAIIRLENGVIKAYAINFAKGSDGIWRIDSM